MHALDVHAQVFSIRVGEFRDGSRAGPFQCRAYEPHKSFDAPEDSYNIKEDLVSTAKLIAVPVVVIIADDK
jgi:hypothetical protein